MSIKTLTSRLLYGELSPNEIRQLEADETKGGLDHETQEKLYQRNKNIIFKRKKIWTTKKR